MPKSKFTDSLIAQVGRLLGKDFSDYTEDELLDELETTDSIEDIQASQNDILARLSALEGENHEEEAEEEDQEDEDDDIEEELNEELENTVLASALSSLVDEIKDLKAELKQVKGEMKEEVQSKVGKRSRRKAPKVDLDAKSNQDTDDDLEEAASKTLQVLHGDMKVTRKPWQKL